MFSSPQKNYRLRAEWEPHEATWLSWPHNPDTWPGIPLEKIESIWVQMVQALSPGEQVHINGGNQEDCLRIQKILEKADIDLTQVILHPFKTNDAWVRDHGPIFVFEESAENKKRLLLDWEYNAWGGKYPPYDLDNQIPQQIAETLNCERLVPSIVLEGGSIEVNGQGTLLTTESCLLNPNRNPQLNKEEIETYLKKYFGVTNILWLGDGIVGDDTDGHVDDLTRFVGPQTVVTVIEEDPQDKNYHALQNNLSRLQNMKEEQGRPLKLVQLPMPAPLYALQYGEQVRLPASYANFYIGNQVVLVPIFDDPKDELALEILRPLFPTRKVIGIDCRNLVAGLGAIHCVTQQMPSWPSS